MSDPRQIKIFDTTLRDGEQSPGASMNLQEKLEIAQALIDLKVDVIEAGFPIASPGDFEAVKEVATSFRGSTICGLARCNDADIDRAWDAVKLAAAPRIHVFLATSAVHREFKLRMSQEEILERTIAGVKRAAGYCDDVEFSPEDAARTEHEFLCKVVEQAIDAGATTVNIPDTVGYAVPQQLGSTITMLRNKVPNIEQATISIHCHNDLGLAVANSLTAIEQGAGQIECTINGIGERAGNCSLEEIVMAMQTRADYYDCTTRIETHRLVPTSRLVSSITGIQVQRNKAIVGRNAFAHEAGIHQDGMLKERTTYEIMRPEDVGFTKTDLVLGKHSGRAALADRAKALGYHLNGEQLLGVFEEFKKLADKKKEVYDGDIVALAQQQLQIASRGEWQLISYDLQSTSTGDHRVRVHLQCDELQETTESTDGDGPVNAAFSAIEEITGIKMKCKDFQLRSATIGRDAQGEATIEVEYQGSNFRGRGVSTNTMEATIKAILNVVNRIAISGTAIGDNSGGT
jgi:2-isopropylmalate synthase